MKMWNLGGLWDCEEGGGGKNKEEGGGTRRKGEERGGGRRNAEGTTDHLCDCPVPTEHPVHHALSSDHPVKGGGGGGRREEGGGGR